MGNKFVVWGVYCFGVSMCSFRISTAVSNVFWAVGILLCLYGLYKKKQSNSFGYDHSTIKTYKVYCLFVMAMIPSVLFSFDHNVSIKTFANICLYRAIPFLLLPLLIHDKQTIIKVLGAFLIAESIESLVAGWQVLDGANRGWGFGGHVMHFAGLLAIIVPPLIVCLVDENVDSKIRKICFVTVPTFFIGIIAGQSRGLWLALVVIVPFLISKYILSNKKIMIVFLTIMTSVLVLFVTSPKLSHRVQSITNITTNVSNVDRLILWESSINMIKDYPITGIGLGNWDAVYDREYKLEKIKQKHLNHTHNNYLQIFAEAGLIGIIGFISFTVYMLYSNFSVWRNTGNPYALMLFAVWAGFSAFGMIDSTITATANSKTLWFMSAIFLTLKCLWGKQS